MRVLPAAFLTVTVASFVAAQTALPPTDTLPAAPVATFPNPGTATWMSVGFTVLPVAIDALASSSGNGSGGLTTLGLLVGPAAGFWYGGVSGKVWPGLLIRTGGLLLAAVGAVGCELAVYDHATTTGSTSCGSGANAFIIGGALVVVGSAIYDIATVGRKVRDHNAQRARAMVVPLFTPSQRRVGLVVTVGF